ncbi:MAG: acylphosphatase [Luteimonas sp.]
MTAARLLIAGHVQGVFFRASAREQAQRLGLRGHARNLADGLRDEENLRLKVLTCMLPEL